MEKRDKINYLKLKVSIDGMRFNTTSREEYNYSAKRGKKMRIYLFPQNETVWENLKNRRNRDRNLWKKIALQVMEKYGYSNPKMTFSQKAGCGCGCSPGFVVEEKNSKELFIDYKQVKK